MSHPAPAARTLRTGLTGLALLALAAPVSANVGVPMITYAWPAAWLLLVPVVLLEAVVARRTLHTTWRRALVVAAASNLVSTLVGIPLAWGGVLLAGSLVREITPRAIHGWVMKPFHAAWLPALPDHLPWLLPAAGATLCVPFFFASVLVELLVARRFAGFAPADVGRWAWRANLLSYALIVAGLVAVAVALHRG